MTLLTVQGRSGMRQVRHPARVHMRVTREQWRSLLGDLMGVAREVTHVHTCTLHMCMLPVHTYIPRATPALLHTACYTCTPVYHMHICTLHMHTCTLHNILTHYTHQALPPSHRN